MNVLLLAAEAAPYAKEGGLADVARALPPALRRMGHDARVVMPRYGMIDPSRWGLTPVLPPFRFPAGHEAIQASLLQGEQESVPVYFVEIPWLFGDRLTLYGHGDDPRRFYLFCGAALAAMERLGWQPDVLHANDWHTAIVPAMLRGGRAGAFFVDAASVLTIHNLAYQGWAERDALQGAAGLLPHWVREQWVNTLGLGASTADLITTVSPTYAREILTPEYGEGLDAQLPLARGPPARRAERHRYGALRSGGGSAIPARYSAEDPDPKALCKEALQREAGFAPDPETPLLGLVSRLVDQKGLDLFAAAVEPLLQLPLQIVVLGTGQPHYHALLALLETRYGGRLRAWLTFDAALAQRIYAGADMFLMPSRFEPCGLSQMIAMRYGAVPVVRATGGLADTVREGPPGDPGTGFVFWEYRADALAGAVRRALAAYRRRDEWAALVRNGMREDNSWTHAAQAYSDLYVQGVRLRRGQ